MNSGLNSNAFVCNGRKAEDTAINMSINRYTEFFIVIEV